MTETEVNTQALTTNTEWLIISTVIVIVIFIGGFFVDKYRTKNVIKKIKNKKGDISQTGGGNVIEDVDNEEGRMTQN